MTSPSPRIQIISTDSAVASPQRIQIVTDQQTGQKIQIVTAVDASGSPKQQFILTSPDGAGTGKVILASPETSSAKQLIFTTSDNLVPGRIQIVTDSASVERLLGKADVQRPQVVEYCVVCGDKASECALSAEVRTVSDPFISTSPPSCSARRSTLQTFHQMNEVLT